MVFVVDGRWYSWSMVPEVDGIHGRLYPWSMVSTGDDTHMHTCQQKEKPNQTVFSVIRYMHLPAGMYDVLRHATTLTVHFPTGFRPWLAISPFQGFLERL
jgi:hypothetical protein